MLSLLCSVLITQYWNSLRAAPSRLGRFSSEEGGPIYMTSCYVARSLVEASARDRIKAPESILGDILQYFYKENILFYYKHELSQILNLISLLKIMSECN